MMQTELKPRGGGRPPPPIIAEGSRIALTKQLQDFKDDLGKNEIALIRSCRSPSLAPLPR